MKPAVKVLKSDHSPHWLVFDTREFWPIISAHHTHAEAIHHAHQWATARALNPPPPPTRGKPGEPW